MIKIYNNETLHKFELLQEARKDLIGEIDAILQYETHIQNSTDSVCKQTWEDIKNEEMVHVGELLGLINYLDSSQKQFIDEGGGKRV